jgi:hypothetical protein
MSFLGLFKLNDVTRSTLVVPKMTQQEFIKRISLVTDQTTNVGFLAKEKKFHGLINHDRFRLERIQTFKNEEFIIKGEIKEEDEKLVVKLEFIRGPAQTILPTFFFILGAIILFHFVKNENLDWRYVPFILVFMLLFLGAFELTKKTEIEKIKELLKDIVTSNVN